MDIPGRVHILGASGSGTTTLGAALAAKHGHRHLDTDDFYWLPTDPPYRQPRPREERLPLLRGMLAEAPRWVLTGSLCGWGDPLLPYFELVVLLLVPTEVRLARLRERELDRYGHDAIFPGGCRYRAHMDFIAWAGHYDEGDATMRSRVLHEAWVAKALGAVLRLEGDRPVEELVSLVEGSPERGAGAAAPLAGCLNMRE